MEHKNYIDIEAYNQKMFEGFRSGNLIYIEEKIDGANASFQYNLETGTIEAFSRKTKLDEKNTLRGFYEWTNTLNKKAFTEVGNLRFFGEWLIKHTVPYPQSAYQNFYLFDIYDTNKKKWLPQPMVQFFSNALGLKMVPILYVGPFISIAECAKYVGLTELGGEYGEGIVIKNMDTLNSGNRLPSYAKIVGEKFAERHTCHVKAVDPEKFKQQEEQRKIVQSVVTEARVRKLLWKLVDEGILVEDWDAKDMGTIAKNLGKALYADCVKEANEVVESVENFGKLANSEGMLIVKKIINENKVIF